MHRVHAFLPTVNGSLTKHFRVLQFSLIGLMLAVLSACALVPGDQTYGMREQSAIKLPVKQNGEEVPANVKVEAITADLIIAMDKAQKAIASPQAGQAPAGQAQAEKETAGMDMSDYKIGPGDILSITVWEHPELTIPAGSFRDASSAGNLVSEDGTVYYPYAGVVHVAGLTAAEVRKILAQKLSRVIEKIQIDVRVISFRSKRVYMVGEVKAPGQVPITDIPMTILDAVNLAGGFTPDADHSQVQLTRAGKTWRVDLQALYEDGAVDQNIKLLPGDIVNVPDRAFNQVFVLGDVQKAGPMFMNKKRLTLAEALANAGYINQFTANPAWIFVMRGQADKPELFHLNSKTPDALILADRFPLRPHDIVYIDSSEVARWNRVISNVLPTATMLQTISTTPYPLIVGRPH